jgi:hypothetical protein
MPIASPSGDKKGDSMHLGFRATAAAFAITAVFLGATVARAGDDGAAPLWMGIGSIFGGLGLNPFGKEEEKPLIDYREHGKIVVPPKIELPPPGAMAPVADSGAWPVNQEAAQRKRILKEAGKQTIAGQGDARLRYTHPFDPNTPVTVRASDQIDPATSCPHGVCESSTPSSSMLGGLNPLSWVGMGKKTALGPEPEREWLTDPPKGYRAPVEPTGQAAK